MPARPACFSSGPAGAIIGLAAASWVVRRPLCSRLGYEVPQPCWQDPSSSSPVHTVDGWRSYAPWPAAHAPHAVGPTAACCCRRCWPRLRSRSAAGVAASLLPTGRNGWAIWTSSRPGAARRRQNGRRPKRSNTRPSVIFLPRWPATSPATRPTCAACALWSGGRLTTASGWAQATTTAPPRPRPARPAPHRDAAIRPGARTWQPCWRCCGPWVPRRA